MSGIRIGLGVTLLIAGASGAQAGDRSYFDYGMPAYSCAAPLTCAAPANCAMPNCAMPMNFGCAAPSCAAPLTCAAPMNCAVPSCAVPTYAAPYGGYDFGVGVPEGMIEPYPFSGTISAMRYPTRGIVPAVIPGDEIVW